MKSTDFEVRKVRITAEVEQAFSVLYLSDLHFNGRSQAVAEWLLDQIYSLKPDLLLLGGDYVDTRKGLVILRYFLSRLPTTNKRFAIAGNHDYFFGIKKLSTLFYEYGIEWIEKSTTLLQQEVVSIQLAGNQNQLMNNTNSFNILCAHNPNLFDQRMSNYDLAFAGHLHGSQVVLWQNEQGLYPGRLFYRWNLLRKEINGCTFLISKGLGDTLPIRYNCKKDIIFVEVLPAASAP